jgi:hypothetical protein
MPAEGLPYTVYVWRDATGHLYVSEKKKEVPLGQFGEYLLMRISEMVKTERSENHSGESNT